MPKLLNTPSNVENVKKKLKRLEKVNAFSIYKLNAFDLSILAQECLWEIERLQEEVKELKCSE